VTDGDEEDEGEGDRTLAGWFTAHQRYFSRHAAREGLKTHDAIEDGIRAFCNSVASCYRGLKDASWTGLDALGNDSRLASGAQPSPGAYEAYGSVPFEEVEKRPQRIPAR
jgi:hypothetical protein